MKTVQISYDLFLDLAMYHLRGEDDFEEEIILAPQMVHGGARMILKKKSGRAWSKSSTPC